MPRRSNPQTAFPSAGGISMQEMCSLLEQECMLMGSGLAKQAEAQPRGAGGQAKRVEHQPRGEGQAKRAETRQSGAGQAKRAETRPSGAGQAKRAEAQPREDGRRGRTATQPAARLQLDRDPRVEDFKMTSHAQWTNNWTINPGGKDAAPVLHPYARDNERRLEERIATVASLPLQFKEPTVYALHNEALRRKMTMEDMLTDVTTRKMLSEPTEIMWNMGHLAGKMFKTFDVRNNDTEMGQPVEPPLGTAVLESPPEFIPMYERAAILVKHLFEEEEKRPTLGFSNKPIKGHKSGKRFLGYNPDKRSQTGGRNYAATLADILFYLPKELADFVVAYCKGLAEKIGCQYDCIRLWAPFFIMYLEGSGFKFHLDGIADFGGYPGFVFNLALAYFGDQRALHPKYFDMIDLFSTTKEGHPAVRFKLDQYDTHVMSGKARTLHPHGVPDGHIKEMITFAIKCPWVSLKYKHAWVKEVKFVCHGISFEKPIQYIDGKEGLKATRRQAAHRLGV